MSVSNLLSLNTEENPALQLFFGSDSQTFRKIALISSISDSILLSSLCLVSFRFSSSTTTTTTKSKTARDRVYAAAAEKLSSKHFWKSHVSAFLVLASGHFIVNSFSRTSEKHRNYASKVAADTSEQLVEKFTPKFLRDWSGGSSSSDKKRTISDTFSSSSSTLLIEDDEKQQHNNKKKAAAAAAPISNQEIENAFEEMPGSFHRTRSSQFARALALSPFELVSIGLFSSYYGGRARAFEGKTGVVQYLWNRSSRSFLSIVIPTVLVTTSIRLAPEFVRTSYNFNNNNNNNSNIPDTEQSDDNHKNTSKSSNNNQNNNNNDWSREVLVRFFALPIASAFAMRFVSRHWGASAISRSASVTTNATGAETVKKKMKGILSRSFSFFFRTTTTSTTTTGTATTAATSSSSSSVKKAGSFLLSYFVTFPLEVYFNALYISFMTFCASVLTSLAIYATRMYHDEKNKLKSNNHNEISSSSSSSNSSSNNDANSYLRSRDGKLLTHLASSALPSLFSELPFLTSTASATTVLKESARVAVFGDGKVSNSARREILKDLLKQCKMEIKEVEKELIVFKLVDKIEEKKTKTTANGDNNNNNNNDNNSLNLLLENMSLLDERRSNLEALQQKLKNFENELEDYSSSQHNEVWRDRFFFSKQNAESKTTPNLKLQYAVRKIAPTLLTKNKLTVEEQTSLLVIDALL